MYYYIRTLLCVVCPHSCKLKEENDMRYRYSSIVIAIALIILSMAVLGCTGSQTMTNNQTATAGVTVTASPTNSGILPTINFGKQDLLAPYKNPDGSFAKEITDENINEPLKAAAMAYALFTAGTPDLKGLDTNDTTNPSVRWSISMYQENKYKSVIFDINNVKDESGINHNVKMTIIIRETGDDPKVYISSASRDGKDLLPTYTGLGALTIPTKLTIPSDKILD